MIKKEYRLEDYIISEYDQHVHTWEMNMVLGEHRVGNCFIVGKILIFESWSHEKEGCLKLEFHERLRRLPVWRKSRYYCFSHGLRDVSTGQLLSNSLIRDLPNKNVVTPGPLRIPERGAFRLARYKIKVEDNGCLFWEFYEGLNSVRTGVCIIESGILFLLPETKTSPETQSRKEWVKKNRLLPKWDQSLAWGHWNILRECFSEQKVKNSKVSIGEMAPKATWTRGSLPGSRKITTEGERFTFLPPNAGLLGSSWYRNTKWKNLWARFYPRVIDALESGIRIFIHILRKLLSWICSLKEFIFRHFK